MHALAWASIHSSLQTPCTRCMYCAELAREEMESAQGFVAAILWVLLLPIHETKSHPRLMCGLAEASICASLQNPCTQNMYCAELALISETKSHPRPLCCLAWAHRSVRAALLTCMLHSVSASPAPLCFSLQFNGSLC